MAPGLTDEKDEESRRWHSTLAGRHHDQLAGEPIRAADTKSAGDRPGNREVGSNLFRKQGLSPICCLSPICAPGFCIESRQKIRSPCLTSSTVRVNINEVESLRVSGVLVQRSKFKVFGSDLDRSAFRLMFIQCVLFGRMMDSASLGL